MQKHQDTPGQALRSLRKLSGMTLKEVAVAADTSISYLSKVERGTYAPTSEYIGNIASIIGRHLKGEARPAWQGAS